MYPILARLPNAFLYSYTAVFALALLGTAAWNAWRATPALAGWWDGLLAAVAGGLMGGRVAFVLGNWDYFAENSAVIWRMGQGGLGYFGVVYGALVGLWLWGWWHKRPLTPYLDFWAIPLLLLHAAGWLACYLHGLAYGRSAPLAAWYTAVLPDNFGVVDVRYPVQLWGIALYVLAVLATYLWPPMRHWGYSLAVATLLHALLTLWRGDPMPIWLGYRADMWLGLGTAVWGASASRFMSIVTIQAGRDRV
jgi:phosphatidylglycerol---prolipoprotein diacylglyceryl transferase